LTARDATMVLPTIVSRCQILNLRPLAISEVEEALVARGKVEKDRARLIARLSGGRIGWAMRASADAAMLEARVRYLDELDAVLSEGRAERIARAGELDKQKEELPDVLDAWISWWRDVLLIQTGDGARITNVDRENNLRNAATRFARDQIYRAIQRARETARYLAQNVNDRLAMEVLILELPSV
ncbi:MAG: hypothetical protein HY070_03100, partial [Chloroflexi bacterium]|nr:hypothetical protein [Chloroflexota bacterium]